MIIILARQAIWDRPYSGLAMIVWPYGAVLSGVAMMISILARQAIWGRPYSGLAMMILILFRQPYGAVLIAGWR